MVDHGENGGIIIREGDRFTIPAGWLRISLAPDSPGKLFRPGLKFFLKQLFLSGQPKSAVEVPDLLNRYDEIADTILEGSDLVAEFDLESEAGAKAALEVLEKNQTSREWYAALLGVFAKIASGAIEANDAGKAAWATYHAATAHALVVVTEPVFEQTLWRGYLANQVVYEAAVAAAGTPTEAEAVKKLEPLFRRLDEATLHAWVHGGEPIGPKLRVTSLSEPLLKALAEWHLALFDRRRADEAQAKEDAKFVRNLRLKWAGLGVTLAGILISAAVVILKELEVL